MGNSLAVQWLGLCAFTAESLGSIPGWGTKIARVAQRGQKQTNKTKKTHQMCILTNGKFYSMCIIPKQSRLKGRGELQDM